MGGFGWWLGAERTPASGLGSRSAW